jgi:type IV fimbrial biogenesis protein FimT
MGMPIKSTNHKHSRRGFSMLELVVVMVIVGIMAALAAPSISTVMRHNRVNRAAAVITSDFQNAFAVAARQREPVRIQADASTQSYQFIDRRSGTVLRTRTFYGSTSDYSLTSLVFHPATIDVFPNGVSSAVDTVDLADGDYSKRITASTAGFVRVK